MRLPLTDYATFVFDCDGVILNSNSVKTQAFYDAALPYGEAAAQELVRYHVLNGGISRYKKFSYFINFMLPKKQIGPTLDELLTRYAYQIREGLLNCEVAEGIQQLRMQTRKVRWLIVSGGDQNELHEIFAQRGITSLFDSGIFGSPDTKHEILARELASGNIQQPALFFGDSKYDHQAATASNLDFLFLTKWSEVEDYATWLHQNNIMAISDLQEILNV